MAATLLASDDNRFGLDRRVMLPGPFALMSGQSLPQLEIGYETYGRLNSDGSNAILICHALTMDQYVASRHPRTGKPGWWPRLVGPGLPIDPDRHFIISRTCSAVAAARPGRGASTR